MHKDKNSHIFMPENHMDNLYGSKNPLVKFVHLQRLDAINEAMPNKKRLRVLDAGCGEGHLINELHKKNKTHSYYGIDLTEVALKKARGRCPFAKFEKKDLTNLKLGSGFFDVVIATEVLEHIINYKSAISELKRVTTHGGILIITFPNETLWTVSRFLLGRRPIKVPDHVNSFNPKVIKGVVGLNLSMQKNLPFGLPFTISLGSLMKFQK